MKIEPIFLAGASSVGGDATLEGRTGAILGGLLTHPVLNQDGSRSAKEAEKGWPPQAATNIA